MASIQILSGSVVEIELAGDITIAQSAQLKEELSRVIDLERDICVSFSKVSALDITAFQLLWAAARRARTMGRAFSFKGSLPPHIVAGLDEAGLPIASLLEGQS